MTEPVTESKRWEMLLDELLPLVGTEALSQQAQEILADLRSADPACRQRVLREIQDLMQADPLEQP